MENSDKDNILLSIDTEDGLRNAAKVLVKFAGNERIIAFYGEMGAGKTTFIKAICGELGVKGGMSSPTFSIVNEYLSQRGDKVYHFDFYRLKEENEALEIGVMEYFDSGCYCLMEWPEKILNLLPEQRINVRILVEHNKRLITFSHE